MKFRYYAPALGRFISRDPIGFGGGINLYAYCGGDPINCADPKGLDFVLGPSDHPWLVFNWGDTVEGLVVGSHAVVNRFSGGLYQPPTWIQILRQDGTQACHPHLQEPGV